MRVIALRTADVAAMVEAVPDDLNGYVLGQDRSGVFVLTDVWRRVDSTWRLWRRHSTPLSAGALPGA